MTSKQVLLTFGALLFASAALAMSGCSLFEPRAETLASPYERRQVWAVVPLRNESGSLRVDGARLADKLAHTLEETAGLDVLPVNRVLATMDALEMSGVDGVERAMALVKALDVDGLVVGTVTAHEPYDPPTLGMILELYAGPRMQPNPVDLRGLSRSSTDEMTRPMMPEYTRGQPVSSVSGVFDAADPSTRRALRRYAKPRSPQGDVDDPTAHRLYRISMDLYSEFVSHAVCSRLLDAEARRLADARPAETAEGPTPMNEPAS